MAKKAKLIHANGPFEVYRLGHVLIVNENGEFCCNLRKADNGFANPESWIANIIRANAQADQDRARADKIRREEIARYLAKRAERAKAQPNLFD